MDWLSDGAMTQCTTQASYVCFGQVNKLGAPIRAQQITKVEINLLFMYRVSFD